MSESGPPTRGRVSVTAGNHRCPLPSLTPDERSELAREAESFRCFWGCDECGSLWTADYSDCRHFAWQRARDSSALWKQAEGARLTEMVRGQE